MINGNVKSKSPSPNKKQKEIIPIGLRIFVTIEIAHINNINNVMSKKL